MTLIDKSIAAALKVLDGWPGTPEELGSDLADATMTVDPPGWSDEERTRWRSRLERKRSARNRILSVKGGEELLRIEERMMKR